MLAVYVRIDQLRTDASLGCSDRKFWVSARSFLGSPTNVSGYRLSLYLDETIRCVEKFGS